MRYLNLKLNNSKFKLLHYTSNSSDPGVHHHSDEYQITVPISGKLILELNKNPTNLNKNTRMLIPPGERHFHYTEADESRFLLINFKKNLIENVMCTRLNQMSKGIVFSNYVEGSSEKLIKIANEVIRMSLFHDDESARIEEMEWELAETLLTLQEGSHSEQWRKEVIVEQHPIIKNVVGYICDNYQEEISLEHLAAVAKISKYYLIRTFKNIMGCTPSQYLLNYRIDRSIDLLLSTKLDVTTICFEVGFGSLITFERTFKKRMGYTVSEFRKISKV